MVHTYGKCTSLKSITIPNSVTEIYSGAFYGCSGLTGINIPSSVTRIGIYAFEGCTGLTSITIPSSVTEIGLRAFSECGSLESISVSKENTVYDSRDNCNAIIKTATNELINGCKNTVIPNSVTEIWRYAFSGCTGLTSINIPNSVTNIPEGAFSGCTGLTSIEIPSSVTYIANHFPSWRWQQAFSYCGSLESISVSKDNTQYDSRDNCNAIIATASNLLIYGCKNTVIPSSVTSINYYAFTDCDSLECVTCLSTTPPSLCSYNGRDPFSDKTYEQATLYVPLGSADAYKNADGWKNFENIVEKDLTAIEPVKYEKKDKASVIYDLEGHKLSAPQKGINIINGKKVLVR